MAELENADEMLHASVRPGAVLAGKYAVERVIGNGGMGVVVVANHVDLFERVALKFLLPEAVDNEEAATRFSREARAAFKIKSEHVARVIDVGKLDTGAPYMVMEFLDGSDLDSVLAERGKLPVAEAVDYILQACEAIAEAHTLGIVHRDLKPANLFLTRRRDGSPCIKVLDFGLSKVGLQIEPRRRGMSMTRTRQTLGSPLYMSPEQMTSPRDVDVGTDIWAIGVMLYELITNQLPFQADDLPNLRKKILGGEPEPLSKYRKDAPPGLDAVIARCLHKDRSGRWANIADLAVALAPFGPPRGKMSAERIARMIEASGQPLVARPLSAWSESAPSRTIPDPTSSGPATMPSGGWIGAVMALPMQAKAAIAGSLVAAAVLAATITALASGGSEKEPDARPAPASTTPKKSK